MHLFSLCLHFEVVSSVHQLNVVVFQTLVLQQKQFDLLSGLIPLSKNLKQEYTHIRKKSQLPLPPPPPPPSLP